MAKRFGVSDLRQQLPSLLDKVQAQGEEIIVTRNGKDIAKVSPVARPGTRGRRSSR
ncbi:type II toxin-antitoxin system Phd/YefM family antitoxin [Deinococcus wulumuqiensis]|uniref:type II toxin-antitoxin system Phd/YefM family antitoxin n=1 Tax=Deinococcus wulumuqiensis TaxID=980427 RepID=UPI00178C4227|nr:type II toxin-antitoxin system Phd/YefM family antitoxin [Deinococcus wulumuqiensis]